MPLLECKGLTKQFGALVAVENVDMSLEPGEIRAALPAAPPDEPEPFSAVLRELDEVLVRAFSPVPGRQNARTRASSSSFSIDVLLTWLKASRSPQRRWIGR